MLDFSIDVNIRLLFPVSSSVAYSFTMSKQKLGPKSFIKLSLVIRKSIRTSIIKLFTDVIYGIPL